MADNVQFSPQNPYALFSPDQWLNQFSNFNNKALPWPSSYSGMPTDAMGNPIAPPQGMTLNSSPAAPPAAAAPPPPPQQAPLNIAPSYPTDARGNSVPGWQRPPPQQPAPQQAAPQAPPPAAAPGQPSYPQILQMLANPGKVTTPGANVPASPTSAQPGSGGLQAFLANWRPAQSGPGSGFQQGFANALKGMGY